VLNKSDLADEDATKGWIARYGKALALNSMTGQGVNTLMKKLERIAADKAASGTSKAGIPVRLMIVGIPNSGKSSLINRLTRRRAAQVGDRPGVTRGKQWLALENGMHLLDTPGILWPKFEDPQVGLNLAFCGTIKDEIMDVQDLGLELIRTLLRNHEHLLAHRYGFIIREDTFLDEDEEECGITDYALPCMEEIARRRGFVLQGGRIDYDRTARTVLDEFRAGKIGRITLEMPI
jgi:ribosome biogenesis GTPase A